MSTLIYWSLIAVLSGFVPAPQQPIIRMAGRLIALSAGFPGRETLLNNAGEIVRNKGYKL